ncbi:MAG: sugar ABC transporter substrate-binding protein [Spirochaetaceae bacterium]|nr:MAG: sugar ABC transporter substrate-binding protein [Spirochaetaceae bacterium]
MKKKVILAFTFVAVLGLVAMPLFGGGRREARPQVTVFWALYDGLTEDYRRELESAFMAAHPDIDLDIVAIPWDNMYDQILTSVAAGDPPDVSVIGTRWLLELKEMGAVLPVEDYVSQALLDNIAEGTKEAELEGVLWGLPVAAGARLMAINKDLTDVVPTTMEELRDAARDAADRTGAYGLILPGQKHTELTDFVYYFYAAGGEFFEVQADGSLGRSTVNSEAGVKALQFMLDLAEEPGLVPDGYLSQTRMDAHPVFYAGNAAYVMIGAWAESSLADAGATFEVEYAQIPGFAGHPSQPLVVTDSLVMFDGAGNPEAAAKFIEFFYQDEWKARFDELIGFPPVTLSAAALPQFDTPLYEALGEAAINAKAWPLMEGWAEYDDRIWDAVSEAFLGRKTPQQALDDAAAAIDRARGF